MSSQPRPTVSEIARQSGFSKATVSLALRGHPKISASTRNQISTLAEQLGYRPDPQRSKLMASISSPQIKGASLGFIRSGLTLEWDPLEKFFYDELRHHSDVNGYNLEPFWLFNPRSTPEKVNATMWNRGIEGLIIPMIHPDQYQQKQRTLPILWEKFCVVEIADTLHQPKLNGIRHNHFGGMLRTLSELEALRYKRIGLYMMSDLQLRTHHRWTAAYLLWKTMRGLTDDLPMLFPETLDGAQLADWVKRYRVDVVVSPGIEVLAALREHGLRVPQDVGFATLHQWGEGSEEVTGINQNMSAQAKIAIDMLISQIYRQALGVPELPIIATDPGYWHAGSTTRRPRRGHQVNDLDSERLTTLSCSEPSPSA
ncbi:LacI family DNA-binding transcriptional regulator [Ruficoccus amylovorans]|uniref:LacI family DNA-binding transcriptional regulator n=1 Tax=Ruficoccus amylovorans TaxID=1804625 RepID=A0A842HGD2_9BACT|nr:LacI family DNA-binding transcriptional regulator [Ruficoccus amylovorans]MBC2595745.1 LacI family DNA-binding transcriptional regulator [Ruficoccus amylovorans]